MIVLTSGDRKMEVSYIKTKPINVRKIEINWYFLSRRGDVKNQNSKRWIAHKVYSVFLIFYRNNDYY